MSVRRVYEVCHWVGTRQMACEAPRPMRDIGYTASLFAKGLSRIAQKVGEEGVEVALVGATEADNLTEEAADLIYHLLVLLFANEKRFSDVLKVLKNRARMKQAGPPKP